VTIRVVERGADDIPDLVGAIDRSEHIEHEYEVVDGVLRERPPTMTDIPDWSHDGDGDFTVAKQVRFCRSVVARGGEVIAALDGDDMMGFVIVVPRFEPPLAWLAWLHVSRPHRRKGAASALWAEAVRRARDAGATSLYVSAVPTDSALGFYFSRGCVLADPPHPELFADEPDDIHLVCPL